MSSRIEKMPCIILWRMTTNYELARAALDEYDTKRADLVDEHDNANRPHVVAQLHQDMRDAGIRARVHAHLAIADAINDHRAGQ